MSLFELLSSLFSYIFITIIFVFIYSIIRLIYMDIRQMNAASMPAMKPVRQASRRAEKEAEDSEFEYEADEDDDSYDEDVDDEAYNDYDDSYGLLRVVNLTRHDFDIADEYLLDKDEVIIGRGGECDIRINDRFLSGRHVRMRFDGNRWFIADMASRNGSYLNGRTLDKRERKLKNGDEISIGSIKFEIEY